MKSPKHDQKNTIPLLRSIFPLIGIWSIYPNAISNFGYLPYIPVLLFACFFLGVSLQIIGQRIALQNKQLSILCLGLLITAWIFPSNFPLLLGYAFSWGLLFSYKNLGLIISLPLSYLAFQHPNLGPTLSIPLIFMIFLSKNHKDSPQKTQWTVIISQLLAGFVLGSIISVFWNLNWVITSPQPISLLFLLFIITPLILLKNSNTKLKESLSISPAFFTFSLSIFWLALGFLGSELILGTFSPLQVVSFFVLFLSLYVLFLPAQKPSFVLLGLSLGLFLFWLYSSDFTLGFWIILICFFGLLFPQLKNRILYSFSLAIILFGFSTQRDNTFTSPQINLFYPKAESPKMTAFFNQFGWWFSLPSSLASSEMSFNVTILKENRLILENIDFKEKIRERKNEKFFASILQHVPNNSEQITILNDITGQFLAEYHQAHHPLININHSNPPLLRFQAQTNPNRKELWLQPNITIHPIHAEELLGNISSQNLIVELIHVPWPSPISPNLQAKHIKKLANSIQPDGSVALILHLNSIPEFSFLPITQLVEDQFSHVQYWLPKDNVDSILILARNSPISFQAMKNSIQKDKKEPYSLLSHAFSTKLPPPTKINIPTPPQYPKIPILHLGSLSDSVQEPAEIWTDIKEEDQRKLEPLIQQKSHFLSMVHKAAQGNMSEVLQQAQHSLEKSSLQTLITPHINSAKKEMMLAIKEGQTSEHWSKAKQFVSTAQLIAPEAVEPWLLQGEIAIGEGFLELGVEKFEKALELEENSLPALNGLARIAGLQKDSPKAEAYLQQAFTYHPNNWTTIHNLAVFYQENGNLTVAEKYAQKAVPLSNQHEKPQIALINIHIAQEKWTLALMEVDRLLQQQDSAFAWFLRGRIHFELKIWDKAEEDFRRATLSDPQLHAARGSIGLVRIAQGDKEGALQAFQATLKFDPNNEIARKNIQQLQRELD